MNTIESARTLRKMLHSIPEASGHETKTKAALIDYLKKASDLEIVDCGKWFYAAHREAAGLEGLAFRADMDAVIGADGAPYHGCGHDGHASVMAALAASISGKRFGKNIFFLFQHAEETGEGGADCLPFFDMERIDCIFAFHNCPGFPEGSVLLLRDTFACASRGLMLEFSGAQSHAAYPENSRNPIFPMAEFFGRWGEMTDPARYRGLVLATPVCFNAGSRAFGVAAGSGEIDLTLRAWYDEELEKLEETVRITAAALAQRAGVEVSASVQDVFPATVNDPELYALAENAANAAGLETLSPKEPFRWSEDFGHYGSRTRAFMCGIGGGEDAPVLHTPDYSWNEAVSEAAIKLFSQIIKG